MFFFLLILLFLCRHHVVIPIEKKGVISFFLSQAVLSAGVLVWCDLWVVF